MEKKRPETSEKKPQILNLSPSTDLVFKGPFSEVVTSTLTLQNPTNDPVIFKVKTTAPKHYCVRPNSGLLNGLESTVISVMLQPIEEATASRSKHKFMVQTMMAPPGFQPNTLDAVWSSTSKSELMDSKLQCVFVEGPPSTTGSVGTANSGTAPLRSPSVEEPASPDETPSSSAGSDSKLQQSQEGPAVGGVVTPEAAPSSSAGSSVAPSTLPSGAGGTPAMEKAVADSKLRQLQNKVDLLTNENVQLKGEAGKLRQRLGTAAATSPGSVVKADRSVAGPKRHLSLVAIMLILVAIVLGYLVGKWL